MTRETLPPDSPTSRRFHLWIGSRRRIALPAIAHKELGIQPGDMLELVIGQGRVEVRRAGAAKQSR